MVTAPYIGTTLVTMIAVAKTVTRPDGSLIGVQSVDVTLGWLTSLIDEGTIWDSGYLMLVNNDGTIIADPANRDNVFKNIADIAGPPYEGLTDAILRDGINQINDPKYDVILYPTKISEWRVIAVVDKSELAAVERKIVTSIWSVTGSLAIIFIGLGFFIAGRITRPIEHVSESLHQMVDGDVDFDNALEVTSDDEIGKLAMWFNAFFESAKKKQSMLVHAQKLESIGHLAAGIAHGINTPAQYIGDNTRLLKDAYGDLGSLKSKSKALTASCNDTVAAESIRQAMKEADTDYLQTEIPRAIEQSLEGVERVSRIIRAMKKFSHPSRVMEFIDLNDAIKSTIIIASNEWKYVAEMKTDLDQELPSVSCLPGEINQVILSMIVNAAHAISDVLDENSGQLGQISISTQWMGDSVEIQIRDTGAGMPEEIKERVFDPFLTTKEVGKGTGQGLNIAYAVIVQKHSGTIRVDCTPGQGSCFTIRLPIQGEFSEEASEAA